MVVRDGFELPPTHRKSLQRWRAFLRRLGENAPTGEFCGLSFAVPTHLIGDSCLVTARPIHFPAGEFTLPTRLALWRGQSAHGPPGRRCFHGTTKSQSARQRKGRCWTRSRIPRPRNRGSPQARESGPPTKMGDCFRRLCFEASQTSFHGPNDRPPASRKNLQQSETVH
jgi:hypothetical protein